MADQESGPPGQETDPAHQDVVLLRRLRDGDDPAYGELYRRHALAVRRFAQRRTRPGIEADDVVAEVFLRVLLAVRRGHGPREHVRTYLFTVVRRVLAEWFAARRDQPFDEDAGAWDPPLADHQAAQAERELLGEAFGRLPARWREVLWRTEVEGHRPAGLAGQLGMTPNAAAVLAHRARRGLRRAYLQVAAVPGPRPPECARRAR